jgi:cytidylate kinase
VIPSNEPHAIPPFVTISRQAGAGAKPLATHLAERLNSLAGESCPWTSWDRELVEKVAADHHLSRELIESLTEHSRSWLDRVMADVSSSAASQMPDDFRVYHRVAETIRAVAQAGRAIIVGRGGMCVTRDMPGGLHVRLIAPFEHRVKEFARRNSIARAEAENAVRRIDRGRERFYRQFFPTGRLSPEHFSVTFNTSRLSEAQIVEALFTMLTCGENGAVTKPAEGERHR